MSDRDRVDTGLRKALSTATRRSLLLGLPLALAACAPAYRGDQTRFTYGGGERARARRAASASGVSSEHLAIYGELDDGRFTVDALDFSEVDPDYLRARVRYDGPERPGTVVVDTAERYLYFVLPGGEAIRYGVGVGRDGFRWKGRAHIARKAPWPTWTPPHEMTLRDPEARKWAGGMPGGPENPLGARAMYLFQGNQDTMYRLHGNNDPSSIGQAVSSGCIRLLNHDVIDLYERVTVGTPVVVLG